MTRSLFAESGSGRSSPWESTVCEGGVTVGADIWAAHDIIDVHVCGLPAPDGALHGLLGLWPSHPFDVAGPVSVRAAMMCVCALRTVSRSPWIVHAAPLPSSQSCRRSAVEIAAVNR